MSVLTSNSENLMSEPTPTKNDEKAGILKPKNSTKCSTSGENRVPTGEKATRSFSPALSFPRAVYERFILSLKEGESAWPCSKELRDLNFPATPGVAPRRKFREYLPRLALERVDGSLALSTKPGEEVLVSKRTGKIIVPSEDAVMVIKRAHIFGSNRTDRASLNDETRVKHGGWNKTMAVLAEDFAINRREFGINKLLIKKVVDQCSTCSFAEMSCDEETVLSSVVESEASETEQIATSKSKKIPVADFAASKKNGSSMTNGSKPSTQSKSPRFASMVAHVPDKECIWYNRESIAGSLNKFSKLLLVINEMKGDMSLAIRGNADAKQRFDTKMYCGQLLIKDYLKCLQQSINGDKDPQASIADFSQLQQEYEDAGQASILASDLQNVLTMVRNDRMALPIPVTKQIEGFLYAQSDVAKHEGERLH